MTQHCPSLYLCKSDHVAEEMTLIDGEALRRITPSEIQGGAWMDKQRKARDICIWLHFYLSFYYCRLVLSCSL